LKLASTIHPKYVDLSFVHSVRSDPQFWKNMRDPQLDPGSHIEFIAERFAKHLTDMKRGDLVHRCDKETTVTFLKEAGIPLTALSVIFALAFGQSINSAVEVGAETFSGTHLTAWGIECLFESAPNVFGSQWNMSPGFKNFVGELRRAELDK
jgi:hypothetical protein